MSGVLERPAVARGAGLRVLNATIRADNIPGLAYYARRGFVETRPDPEDARLLVVLPTEAGRAVIARATPNAFAITEETLAPLDPAERATLLKLLARLR